MHLVNYAKVRWLGLALAAALAVGTAGPAFADSVSVTVTGGTLLMTTTTNAAGGVTLSGLDQTTTYTVDVTVTDPTGTGNGWHVAMTSTTFSTGGGSPKMLSTSASKITARPSASCAVGSTCTVATDGSVVSYPYTVPAGSTAPTATKMYSAAANTGMGAMAFSPTVTVSIPANTYAGTYSSTLTFAIVSGP